LDLRRKHETRKHVLAVDMNRASAALPLITAFFGSRQGKVFAQSIKQGDARFNVQQFPPPVDLQDDLGLIAHNLSCSNSKHQLRGRARSTPRTSLAPTRHAHFRMSYR